MVCLNIAKDFVEHILIYERDPFLWLNKHHNLFWDSFMWIYSEKTTWIPLCLIALVVYAYKVQWKKVTLFVLCMVLLGLLCDQISAGLIKHFFERYRPSRHPDFENYVLLVKDYRGGRFGFVSAHAANGFGIATFTSLIFKYKRFTIIMFSWALITAYSRIYLGVHFISDIIGGMLLGIGLGFFVYYIFQLCRIKFLHQSKEESRLPFYSHQRADVLCYSVLLSILTILLLSTLNFLFGFSLLF